MSVVSVFRMLCLACVLVASGMLNSAAQPNLAPDGSLVNVPFQFGIDVRPYHLPYHGSVANVLPAYMTSTQLMLVRCCGINWSMVEASEGAYNWNERPQDYSYTAAEGITKTLYLFQNGYLPIVELSGVPDWAKKYNRQQPNYECSPLKFDSATYQKFATFAKMLVVKLGQAGVKRFYLQLWNEPDTAARNVPHGGNCWATSNTAAGFGEGGDAYAQMLGYVRAAIQPTSAADPQVAIVAAGLVLECTSITDTTCGSYQFVSHMLGAQVAGRRGIDNIDVLDFHSYAYWSPQTNNQDWDVYGNSYAPLGRVQTKIRIIRQLLAQNGAPTKPILLGEGALVRSACATDACDDMFRDRQANYVVRMYARASGNGLMGASWYSLGGCSDPDNDVTRWGELVTICRSTAQAQPGYATLKFLSNRLAGSVSIGKLPTPANVEGYGFYSPTTARVQYVYWTNTTTQTAQITLASTPDAIYDYKQQSYAPTRTLAVGFDPLLVQMPPASFFVFLPTTQRVP